MRITFVRLPFYVLLGAFKPVYHIGLGCLASVLKGHGHDVQLIDSEAMSFEGFSGYSGRLLRLKTRLMPTKHINFGYNRFKAVMQNSQHEVWKTITRAVMSSNPDLIGITCFTQNVTAAMHLTSILKTHLHEVPVVLGGVHATAEPESTMQYIKDIDYIVIGEGEETIVDLCKVISENKKQQIPGVRGIVYRENGQIKRTPPRPLIHDLDRLPFPDRALGNRSNYTGRSDTIFTSRGCPFNCTFCASQALWTRKVRYRNLDNVLAEIDSLIHQHNALRIRMDDDTFTLSKERVLEFCNRIKERGYHKKVSFDLGSRVDTLDEETICQLAEISTDTISFGIESGSPRILKTIGKKITPEQVEKSVGLASSYGIRCLCFFMVGHPEETIDDVKQTIELFDRIANRYVDPFLNIVTPYPGTQLWTLAKQKGWNLPPLEFYKLFLQGEFMVNLSSMTDQELKGYYNLFLRRTSKHSLFCKANVVGRLAVTGHIRTALRLVLADI